MVVGLEVHCASALDFNAIYIKVASCAALSNANIQHFLKPRFLLQSEVTSHFSNVT